MGLSMSWGFHEASSAWAWLGRMVVGLVHRAYYYPEPYNRKPPKKDQIRLNSEGCPELVWALFWLGPRCMAGGSIGLNEWQLVVAFPAGDRFWTPATSDV